MATLLIHNIKWDCDGDNSVELGLPTTIMVVNADNYDEDDDESTDILSDHLSDVFGFCHEGFFVEKIDGDSVGDQKIDAILEYPNE